VGPVLYRLISHVWQNPYSTLPALRSAVWGFEAVSHDRMWSRIKAANKVLLELRCGKQIHVRGGVVSFD
jgi:hypothetical protein